MSDIASFGFSIDSAPVSAADAILERLARTAAATEAALTKMSASTAAAFAKLAPSTQAALNAAGVAPGGSSTASMSAMATAAAGSTAAQTALAAAATATTSAVARQSTALHGAAQAHASHGAAAYHNALAMQEVTHVGRALFDEMAAGGNVLRGLFMEFGRLQIAYNALEKSGSGVTGGLAQIWDKATSLLTPIRLATGGVAAFGAVSAAAFASYEAGQNQLANALNGTGRRSGATAGQLASIAAQAGMAGPLSRSESLSLTADYAHAGMSADTVASLVGITHDYGRVTGQSTTEAGSALAKGMADPMRGLSEFDKQLGFVDDRLMQQVTALERSGHLQEAQSVATEALRRALEQTTDTTSAFGKAMEGAGNTLSNAWSGLGQGVARFFRANSDADQLSLDKSTLANLQRVDPVGNAGEIADLQREILELQQKVNEADAGAAARRKEATDIGLSRQAGDAIRQLLPDFARAQSATSTIEVLRQAVADPGIRQHLGMGEAGMLNQAFGNAVVMQSMARPGLQQSQDYQLRMAGIDAFSTGEKAIVEARRAELEVLRQTGDVARAAAAAQMSMNEAIAKGNSDARDHLELSKQSAGLVGLSPYERGLQEIKNRYEGYGGLLDKAEAFNPNVRKDPQIGGDLDSAAHRIRLALEDNAPKIEAAGNKLVTALDGLAGRLAGVGGVGGAPSPYGTLSMPAAFRGAGVATPAMIASASAQTGIPAPIIASMGQIENGGRLTGGTTMLGSNGKPSSAWGFGQLTNGAAADVAALHPGFSKYDPDTAVFGSAEYLRILASRNHGDLTAALNAYGGTPGYANRVLAGAEAGSGGVPLNVGVSPGGIVPPAPLAPNMLKPYQQSEKLDVSAYNQEQIEGPLRAANQALRDQAALFDAQVGAAGRSTAALKAAADAQQLLNRYIDADPNRKMGAAAWDKVTEGVNRYRESEEALYKRKDDLEARNQVLATVGTDASDVMSAGTIGALTGKGFGNSARSALASIGEGLIHTGFGSLFGSLFGGGKNPDGGFLGRLLDGLPHHALGTNNAPGGLSVVGEKGPELMRVPAGAQIMPNNALAGMRGGAAPNITVGGHQIIVQGNADEKVLAAMDQKIAAASQQQIEQITRNFGQIQSDAAQTL